MKLEIKKILLIYISVLSLVKLVDYLCQIDNFSFAFGATICIIIDLLFKKFIND